MILDPVNGIRYAGRPLTLALVAALIALLVLGASAAYAIGHSGGLAGQPLGADQPSGAPPSPSETTTTDSVTSGEVTQSSADPQAPLVVTLSPSAEASPNAVEITDLLSRYFTSINRHDYDAWLTTVSTAQAKRDRDSWTTDYSTTYDSDIYVSDITAGDPMTVRIQFVSHQSLEFAPTALPAECVRWDVTYQVLDEGVGLRVGLSAQKPALAPC